MISLENRAFEMMEIQPVDFAEIDHARRCRCGFPEFVFGEGKTPGQVAGIVEEISASGEAVLVTRFPEAAYEEIRGRFPLAVYDKLARAMSIVARDPLPSRGKVVVATAGTSDIPVALEAKLTAELCGCGVETVFDVGVAGIHRLMSKTDILRSADVVVAVAGMEGALPSVVAGLVACPVIAVPTSVGYGASLGGLAAMFAMLNSCANGVAVMNIDNGFGAGCAAARIVGRIHPRN